ncbi:MAG: hypothetical protein ACLPY5_03940 [Candidatus Bathyarchaeia archaeon]
MASQLENVGNILAYLCEHGPSSGYTLRSDAGKVGSPGKFYYTMRRLASSGYIKIASEGNSYSISQSGLIIFLAICAQLGKDRIHTNVNFLNLAKRESTLLPSIFKLWEKFCLQQVGDIAEKILIRAAHNAVGSLRDTPHAKAFLNLLDHLSGRKDFASAIELKFFELDSLLYALYAHLTPDERGRWIEALSKDRHLGKPFVDRLKLKNKVDKSPTDVREIYIWKLTGDPRLEKAINEFEKLQRDTRKKQERKLAKFARGAYTWLSHRITVSGQRVGTRISFDNTSVKIQGAGKFDVPEASIVFDNVSYATTKYQKYHRRWVTTVPVTCSEEIFVSGLTLQGIKWANDTKVSWSGQYRVNTSEAVITSWEWDAPVYKNLSTDYALLNVKATRHGACSNNGQPINNEEPAGSPQAFAFRTRRRTKSFKSSRLKMTRVEDGFGFT